MASLYKKIVPSSAEEVHILLANSTREKRVKLFMISSFSINLLGYLDCRQTVSNCSMVHAESLESAKARPCIHRDFVHYDVMMGRKN